MFVSINYWIRLSWVVFFAGWTVWGITSKRTLRRQSWQSRVPNLLLLTLAVFMLFSPLLRIGPLGWRFLPDSLAAESVAILFTVSGFGFAIWARLHLGGNWSSNVTIKYDHKLIQTGPYALVRHPIYSGISLAAAGLVVVNGDLGSLAGLLLMLFRWRAKFRLEEAFMVEEFGDSYRAYKQNVKALIPYLW